MRNRETLHFTGRQSILLGDTPHAGIGGDAVRILRRGKRKIEREIERERGRERQKERQRDRE